ncbi:alpha/beta fold hydrolase [Labrenzia sp. PHM005]|uniref:alpha/beta fold hydrolase n=1 Tax=Labrenzia sp. PHM005 TaxID=2590016 RepID=UPI00114012DC|nr:alpha/beta hydrolase [Labrenzia sp. PHM005]QDG77351.1 alpha/beta hydrolase [Labrenzia sp. PHM005]
MIPLVLVHGFMGGSGQWELQSPLAATAPLIPVDLPGFGNNADLTPINSIGGFADWVLKYLTGQGIEDFHLLGHSMGGMIVQEMVKRAPERVNRLVLYGTGPLGVMPGRFEPIETSMKRAVEDGPQATAKRISATWFLDCESAREYPACSAIAEQSSLEAILAGLEAMRDWSGRDALDAIRAETLILWGDKDRAYLWPQVETLWSSIPNSHLAVVPGCSHAVHMEEPGLFNQFVARFLDTR